ncbi:MAG: hypothetical protein JJ975_11510 [Bacteroidia bacterium]|nr:hypothetical protein [Bacteroidia bacterium]
MFRSIRNIVILVLSAFLGMTSCSDDPVFITDSSATLDLRQDTVFFDTVFTSLTPRIPRSVNKQIVVVNPHDKPIMTDFRLAGGTSSPYRINVDGEIGPEVNGVEILARDSVFVFVEISADPNNDPEALPLIVRDSIVLTTNGNTQQVQLVAWGQDAHYFLRDTVCNEVFADKEKPYVVYGYLYVPENCNLTIREGVQLHFAPGAWLYVEGSLSILGTKDEPVKFEGDRLQPAFEETAGQWGGIWLDYLSSNNRIRYAEIKNGTVGIFCDSSSTLNVNGPPNVLVENTMVRNMTFDGLSGKTAHIRARNSIFANCGRYTFLGLWGGIYDLKHCNFVTYNYEFARRDPTFVLNNARFNEFGGLEELYGITYNVQNCIVEGSLDEEMGFGIIGRDDTVVFPPGIDTTLDYNLIRTEMNLNKGGQSNVFNQNPEFVDFRKHDYHIPNSSPAKDIGTDVGINIDFENNARDSEPDAGAFEVQ